MNHSSIFILGLMVAGVSCAFTSGFGATNPMIDTSMCPPGDTVTACQTKKNACIGVRKVFQGPGGPVASVIECANATGVAPDPLFYMSIGMAFAKGTPEILADQISPDPSVAKFVRRCTLNATGLLNPNETLNRTAVASAITTSLPAPGMSAAAIEAAYTCPEPKEFQLTGYINCVTSACINSIALAPMKPF